MNKDDLTLELAMRFTVALRPLTLKPDSQGTNMAILKGYDLDSRGIDQKIARFVIAMAKTYAEEFDCGMRGGASVPSPKPRAPEDDDPTLVKWEIERPGKPTIEAP